MSWRRGKSSQNPFEFLEEVAIRLHVAAETLDDALVDAFEGEVVHGAVPALDAGRDLQQVVQAARARNEVAQEMEQQGAFLRHARRGARSKVVPGVRLMKFTLLASRPPGRAVAGERASCGSAGPARAARGRSAG